MIWATITQVCLVVSILLQALTIYYLSKRMDTQSERLQVLTARLTLMELRFQNVFHN